jgi:eukaryotic-like serine/threonine-protein kinase
MSPAEMERTVCGTVAVDPSGMVKRRRGAPSAGLGNARSLRRRLRGDIDRIVMTAMRTEAQQRYPTAQALADDIERHLTGKPVHARGASRLYRTGKFITRYRTGVGAVATIFVAMAVALIAVEQQRERALVEAQRAESAKQFLTEMIQRADPYENTESRTMADAVRQAIPDISEQFAGQPDLEAEMRHATGFALSGLGDYETARAQLEQALAIYTHLGDNIERARVLSALAGVRWGESDYAGADSLYEQATALVENNRTPDGRAATFEILIDWAGLAPKMDQGARGVNLALRAIEMVDSLPEVDPLTHAVLYNNLAASYDGIEAYERAIEAYEKSIELHRLHSDAHPDLATTLGNLGLTYELVGDIDKAVASVARAVSMQRELLGESHPQYVLMLYNLGSLQINAGKLEDAAGNLEAAVEAAEHAYPENHLYTGRFNHRIAVLYERMQRRDQALAHAEIARSVYQRRDDVPPGWLTEIEEILVADNP